MQRRPDEKRRKRTGRFLIVAGLLKIGFQPEPEERPGHRAMWCDAGDGAAAGGSLAGELRAVPHQFLAGTRCPSERTSRRSGCRPGLFPPWCSPAQKSCHSGFSIVRS